MKSNYDVIVIGGGPAGLASGISSKENGADTLIIEREAKLGGILKQCIHDGFGLTRYGQRLTGPEYAYKDIEKVEELNIDLALSTFVLDIKKKDNQYTLILSNCEGIHYVSSKAIVLAMGCRERTAKQVFIHGDRPSGIFTAGTAQYLVNIMGKMPAKKCVILGSGDIGLIMARRLTLEGAEVLGVYEAKNKPSGLNRNIAQCLNDFNIPLYLSKTVTRTFGKDRLEKVEIMDVDEKMQPIEGSEQIIECDTLILSVGLIPENEISEKLNIKLSNKTKGAYVDNNLQSLTDGVFASGNCLSVNDLVDYVSENGFIAGKAASEYVKNNKTRDLVEVKNSKGILTCVPQYLDLNSNLSKVNFYLRSDNNYKDAKIIVKENERVLFERLYKTINQTETQKIILDLSDIKHGIEVDII
ncbi:MAG: NAD(P)/FAD-dependent oxidoreductase [Erysipelotrichaceae bacterium]|nr:NAD(P)/FAD-dependent oxidoreductase [Erysipelotrichaceae bacterium]